MEEESTNGRDRLCGKLAERGMHLVSGCKALAGIEYATRHNNLLKVLLVS